MRMSLFARGLLAVALLLTGAFAVAQAAPVAPQAEIAQGGTARVAIVHAAPFAAGDAAVAVTAQTIVSGSPVGAELILTRNFRFKDFIPYLTLPAGTYRIKLYPAGATIPSSGFVYNEDLTVVAGKDYTALAVGGANSQPLDIVAFEDVRGTPSSGVAKLRVIHAAPFASDVASTAVSVIPDSDTTEANNLIPVASRPFTYGKATDFLTVPAGVVLDYKVVPAGSPSVPAFNVDPVTLNTGDVVSVIAVGDRLVTGNQDVSYIVLPAPAVAPARVRLVHAAPFASGNATVTVTVGGQVVSNSFDFRDITPYRTLPAGLYPTQVFVGSAVSGSPAISGALLLQDGLSYTVVAMGSGAANFPLQLKQLTDNSAPAPSASARLRVLHAAPFAATVAATAVDVRAANGAVISPQLNNIVYDEVRDNIIVPSGMAVDMKIVPAGQANAAPIIDPPAITFNAGSAFTLIAVGGPNSQVAGLLILDDQSVTRTIFLPLLTR